jgi:hypothetical protein
LSATDTRNGLQAGWLGVYSWLAGDVQMQRRRMDTPSEETVRSPRELTDPFGSWISNITSSFRDLRALNRPLSQADKG